MSDVLLLEAQSKVEARARAKRDYFYLSNDVLGYDFQWETHAELFATFPKWDGSKTWDAQSEIKDLMVLWSRGHFKTTALIVVIISAILNFPNIRILLMQGSIPVTKTLLKQVMAHFTGQALGSKLVELFPEYCGDKKALNGTVMQFTTTARTDGKLAQATCTVASPKSVKTGQHYDLGFFDDLVTDQNFRNPKLIQNVQVDFTLAQALIDPGGYRFVSGTRYAFGDLYEQILRWQVKSGKWVVSVTDCWTTETSHLPDAQKVPRFPQFTKKNGEKGGFTREYLLQLQEDDPANFACQYLNKPIHSSQVVFTKELIESAVIKAADAPPLSQPLMVIDLATSDQTAADDSVIMIGKVDNVGVGYLCDQRGGQWVPNDMALNVLDMFLRHRCVKVLLEKSASGMIFAEYLKVVARSKNVFLPVDFIKVNNQPDAKNMRVTALAGAVKRGKFKFFAGLSKFDRLIEQACEFPKGRHGHDDYPDTAALLNLELGKEIMNLPIVRPIGNAILAMIRQQDESLEHVLTETESKEVDLQDTTGLD